MGYEALAPHGSGTCGVIGTGLQAFTQCRAIAALGQPARFRIYSRSPENRAAFAAKLQRDTGIATQAADSAQEVVEQADSLLVATNASQPVFNMAWLERCRHVTTLGPKFTDRHEVSPAIADWAEIILSDSPQQIAAQGDKHFLHGSGHLTRVQHLGHALAQPDPAAKQRRSLFLSAGLSGTEVALLAALAA